MRIALQRQGIQLKTSTPKSPWRNSLAESMVKKFKETMKKSGLKHKSFTLPQWHYVVSKIQFQVNMRPLNIRYATDSLQVITPINLVFGTRKGIFPNDVDLDPETHNLKLYEGVKKLDDEILAWEKVWFSTYSIQLRQWTKFKTQGRQLKVGDIVFLLDRINSESKNNTIGQITEVKSDRTYSVQYVRGKTVIDKNTFQVTKSGKKFTVDRPSLSLCYICSPEKENNINVDAFVF